MAQQQNYNVRDGQKQRGPQQHNRRDEERCGPIRAPYNFVPLSKMVVFAERSASISHDVPFSDAICGTIECELVTTSRVYIRNGGNWSHEQILNNKDAQSFFKIDRDYVIPGTSIKGPIRNVIEIISFGRMKGKVDDRRYSVRDLTKGNKGLYVDRIIKASPKAAWLTQDKVSREWFLTPCDFIRVEQNDLIAYQKEQDRRVPNIKAKQNAKSKYAQWEGSRIVTFNYSTNSGTQNQRTDGVGTKRAVDIGSGSEQGTIVFTGQPADHEFSVSLDSLPGNVRIPDNLEKKIYHRPNKKSGKNELVCKGVMLSSDKRVLLELSTNGRFREAVETLFERSYNERKKYVKHLEFIFYNEGKRAQIENLEKIKEEFEFIHSKNGETNKPNDEWEYWQKQLKKGEKVPVFYVGDSARPKSIGLAYMYRLPYEHTVLDAIGHTSECHVMPYPDLSDAIFGFIGENDGLKGRVYISAAIADPSTVKEAGLEYTVLGGPKPTYYPNYIDQTSPVRTYKTFMDSDCRIRGWKRYPARKHDVTIKPRPEKDRVATRFIPIERDARFTFSVNVHNLRPFELGTLIWALTWGGRENLRHSIGMGKPFGYGQAKITITSTQLFDVKAIRENEIPRVPESGLGSLAQAGMLAFEDYMNQKVKLTNGDAPDWIDTPQLVQLMAMADPECQPSLGKTDQPGGDNQKRKLQFMSIGKGTSSNEFLKAKDSKCRLEPHAWFDGMQDDERFKSLKPDDCIGFLESGNGRFAADLSGDNEAATVGVQSDMPKSVLDKFNAIKRQNSKDKFFEFFQSLKEQDIVELERIDLSAVSSVLNIGVVDEFDASDIMPAVKATVAKLMLSYISPNKKWDSNKKARYEKLKAIAGV